MRYDAMESRWCKDCNSFLKADNEELFHSGHNVMTFGDDRGETITGLDQLIQYGQDTIGTVKRNLEHANQINAEIETSKAKFKSTLRARIEQIVHDLRVALDDHSMQLLADVDEKFEIMQTNAQTFIKTARPKLDIANEFLKKAILTLPDEDGNLNRKEIDDLRTMFTRLENIHNQPKPTLRPVAVNIKYPNTMKMKLQCRHLAQQIVGEIEQNERPSLLNAQRASIDIKDIAQFGEDDI